MTTLFLVVVLLGQTPQTVVIQDPTIGSKRVTTTTSGAKVLLDVSCTGCSSSGDGGSSTVNQGAAADGGVDWATRAKIWDGTDTADVTAASALKVDGSGVTQPISAAALPLPSGAATEATLATMLTSGTFTARLNTLGQKTMANSAPVVIASDQSALPISGTVTANAGTGPWPVTDNGGSLTVDGTVTTSPPSNASTNITQLGGNAIDIGSGVASTGTARVILATDQAALPVTDNGGSLTIDGTVTVTQATGTNLHVVVDTAPTTAVTGPLTDAQLRASAVPVSLTSTTITGTSTVAGAKSNNNAAPGATNVGALVAVANAAAPSQTEGNLVALRTNLAGDVAVTLDSEAVVLGAGAATIGSLAANQSVNTAQFGGTNISTGTGASGAGIPRVTLSNDSSLAANQSVNVSQMNGVAVSMGAGTTGTGVQRVVLPTDQSAIPVTQSGTWTVQPGNTANTTPWLTTDTPRTVASASNSGTCVSVTASTTVLASNASRKTYGFKASEDNTAKVHCKLGATATTSNTIFGPGAGWSQDTGAVYTGVIDCIAASGTQSVCPYELQ